jgi:hypothetical protein
MQQQTGQDTLARRILSFLSENSGTSYTLQELVEERYIYSSKPLIQQSLTGLLREGRIKVKNKGNLLSYQVVLLQQKNKTSDTV